MRLSIIEPLGITEDQAQDLAKEYLPDDVGLAVVGREGSSLG